MTLSEYIPVYMGELYTYFNWGETQINFIISETLAAYGVDTEAEATDKTKLYKLCKIEVWRKAVNDCVQKFNFSADGASYSESQVYEHCKEQYFQAVGDVELTVTEVTYNNPYMWNRRG